MGTGTISKLADGKLLFKKGDDKHNRVQMHKNLEKTEGFPCKNLKKVGIVYRELCSSMCKLSRLIKQQTKEIKGIEIVFIRNSGSFEHGLLFDRFKLVSYLTNFCISCFYIFISGLFSGFYFRHDIFPFAPFLSLFNLHSTKSI